MWSILSLENSKISFVICVYMAPLVALAMRISMFNVDFFERWCRCEICSATFSKTTLMEIRRNNSFEGNDGFLRCLLSGSLVGRRTRFESGGYEDGVRRDYF